MTTAEQCETVKIVAKDKKTQGEFVLINKEDFDPKQHKLFGAEKAANGIKISKTAEKKANDAGLDLETVEGSGKDGAITVADVDAAVEAMNDDNEVNANEGAIALAADAGIELSELEGSGENGMITEDDVIAAMNNGE